MAIKIKPNITSATVQRIALEKTALNVDLDRRVRYAAINQLNFVDSRKTLIKLLDDDLVGDKKRSEIIDGLYVHDNKGSILSPEFHFTIYLMGVHRL